MTAVAEANMQTRETPIPLHRTPDWLDRNIGVRVHLATVYRWSQRGARGHRLNLLHIGGRRYVRPSDLRAFLAAINGGELN